MTVPSAHSSGREPYSEQALGRHLADVAFPATRRELTARAEAAGAPEWVLDVVANLDDVAPFASLHEVWWQATGPDSS